MSDLPDNVKAEADEMFAKLMEAEEAEAYKRAVAKVPMELQAYFAEKYPPPAPPAPPPPPEQPAYQPA